MNITPIGAALEVTGSCFLLETESERFLVDCGLFQGGPDTEEKNREFPFDPKEISAVFLTHAHLDHCGRLPLLQKQGFSGPIYTTAPTRDVAQFILLDAAKLQEEDAQRDSRKKLRAGETPTLPLYTEQDVVYTLSYFQPQPYEQIFSPGKDLQVTFRQSGHILGSAFLEFRQREKTVIFSGDLGSPQRNVVPDPALPSNCDLVFCESTYGDRMHKSRESSIRELADALNWTWKAGGNVVIPSFALERAQDILFILRDLRGRKAIPSNPVFLDSPLSINLTEVYRRHIPDLDAETRSLMAQGVDPFNFPGLRNTVTGEQSKSINNQNQVTVIAGSGMCQGGRVVHHLKHNLWRTDSSVVFVGYQARMTLGRAIVDGAKKVHIYGEPIAVKARILTINGFSAHADQATLQQWLAGTGKARIVLNHGEETAAQNLARELVQQGRQAEVVEPGKSYQI
jgi:metallo-beta-lactamase family protein